MKDTKQQILFEDVDVSSIENAIKRRKPIKVNYISDEDDKTTGSGWRIIQPVAYGLSKKGNPVIRAYQPFGDTKTKVPHWKLFRVDRFETWQPINKPTNIPEPPLAEYNPNGDKSMSEVYINADFAGAKTRYEKGGLQRYNIQRQQKQREQNPYYGLAKNIERSKNTPVPDYVMKNVADWQKTRGKSRWLNGASAEEMSRTTDFGDNIYQQTNTPVMKGDSETNEPTQTKQQAKPQEMQDYKNIALNGPVNKGDEQLKRNNEKETEENTEINNTEK